MTYQVKDWDRNFENDRSRSRRNCSFVCVPNKQHGMGFNRIVSEPDGAAIYGIWQMIIGACSQQIIRNGWLTDDGEQTGSPWGADDLAVKFHRPESEIQRALDFLSSPKVGWIICHKSNNQNELPLTNRVVTVNSPSLHLEEKRREEKGIEEEEKRNEKVFSAESRVVIHFLNDKTGKHFRETDSNITIISARLKEPGVDLDGIKKMIDRQCEKWKGGQMDDYLRPETLFNKTKFDSYYAAKDLPINDNSNRNAFNRPLTPSEQRNAECAGGDDAEWQATLRAKGITPA